MAAHVNNFPKLHNAAWPGLVGKGPDSEPPLDLDTMINHTANANVDGVKNLVAAAACSIKHRHCSSCRCAGLGFRYHVMKRISRRLPLDAITRYPSRKRNRGDVNWRSSSNVSYVFNVDLHDKRERRNETRSIGY